MTTRRTTRLLLTVVGVLTLVAGCGVEAVGGPDQTASAQRSTTTEVPGSTTTEAGDAPPASTTEAPDTTSPRSVPPGTEAFQRQMAAGFQAAGLTEDQASCLAGAYVRQFGTDITAATDQSKMLGLLTDCDISPSDLDGLGSGTFEDQLAAGFKIAGLSEDQAACLAAAYVAEFGNDMTAVADPDRMLAILSGCDVSPSDFGGLGGSGGGG